MNVMAHGSDLIRDVDLGMIGNKSGNKIMEQIAPKNLIEVPDLERMSGKNGFVSQKIEPLGNSTPRGTKTVQHLPTDSEAFQEFQKKMELLTYEQTQSKVVNLYRSSDRWETAGLAIANLSYLLAIAAPICAFFQPIYNQSAFVSGTLGVVAVGLSRIAKQAQVRRNENQKMIKDILEHHQIGAYVPQPINIEAIEDNEDGTRKENV
jgi:hypothetical protein